MFNNKRGICATLSVVMVFFGNCRTFAGTGDPMSEHPSLYEKFRKAVDDNQKNTDSNIPGIRNGVPTIYTRKPDFFSYDELRTITLFNMPALLSSGNSFLHSMLDLLDISFACLEDSKEIAEKHYNGKPLEFMGACADVLKKTDAVKNAAKFLNEDEDVVAEGAIASLLQLPLTSGTAIGAVIVSTISLILDIISIVTIVAPAVSVINHGYVASINAAKATEMGYNTYRSLKNGKLFYGTVKNSSNIFYQAGKAMFSKETIAKAAKLVGAGVTKTTARLGAAATILPAAVAATTAGGIMTAKNGISMNNKFKKERVINVANLLSEIVSKMTRFPNLVLESNCMVIAIDRRNLFTI